MKCVYRIYFFLSSNVYESYAYKCTHAVELIITRSTPCYLRAYAYSSRRVIDARECSRSRAGKYTFTWFDELRAIRVPMRRSHNGHIERARHLSNRNQLAVTYTTCVREIVLCFDDQPVRFGFRISYLLQSCPFARCFLVWHERFVCPGQGVNCVKKIIYIYIYTQVFIEITIILLWPIVIKRLWRINDVMSDIKTVIHSVKSTWIHWFSTIVAY